MQEKLLDFLVESLDFCIGPILTTSVLLIPVGLVVAVIVPGPWGSICVFGGVGLLILILIIMAIASSKK